MGGAVGRLAQPATGGFRDICPADIFDAFVDPDMLCRFWLDAASAPLAPGAEVAILDGDDLLAQTTNQLLAYPASAATGHWMDRRPGPI